MADVFLAPQLYAAKRFEVDMTPYPKINRIAANLEKNPIFQSCHPDNMPDAAKWRHFEILWTKRRSHCGEKSKVVSPSSQVFLLWKEKDTQTPLLSSLLMSPNFVNCWRNFILKRFVLVKWWKILLVLNQTRANLNKPCVSNPYILSTSLKHTLKPNFVNSNKSKPTFSPIFLFSLYKTLLFFSRNQHYSWIFTQICHLYGHESRVEKNNSIYYLILNLRAKDRFRVQLNI